MTLFSDDTFASPFEAWSEIPPVGWRDALGAIAETNYRRNAEVRAAIKTFMDAHQDVDLDHLPLLYTAFNYAVVLGFSLARTESARIEDLDGWVERAWAYGQLDTPIDRLTEPSSEESEGQS